MMIVDVNGIVQFCKEATGTNATASNKCPGFVKTNVQL